jgi:hypothetical protein
MADGSSCELEAQIMPSGDSRYVGGQDLEPPREDIREVERMLKALIRSLEKINP